MAKPKTHDRQRLTMVRTVALRDCRHCLLITGDQRGKTMLDSILAASINAANLILAQPTSAPGSAPAPNGGGGGGSPFGSPLFMIVVIVAIFYFVMFRDQRKKQGSRKQMLASLKKGDKVLTIGGVLGTIVGIKDDEVVIKVDEASNTKITYVRSAIDRVMSEQESK
jgi:preprotein translocase subunit YajC